MSMLMSMPMKINLYATIMPYDFNLALSFHWSDTIGDIHFFIEETFKKLRMRYKVGRIELKNNKAWLLPQYVIGEFLGQKEEIVVYSLEYGITQRELSESSFELEDIDQLFIGKKLKRRRDDEDEDGKKSFVKSRVMSVNVNKVKNNLQSKSKSKGDKANRKEASVHSDADDNDDDDQDEDEQSHDNDDKEEKKKQSSKDEEVDDDDDDDSDAEEGDEDKDEKKNNKSNDEEEDDKSGSDKEDDIPLTSNKKK